MVDWSDRSAGRAIFNRGRGPARNRFHCVAPDYPGYGMSDAPPGYGFTPHEHSTMVERFVDRLGLKELTIMVQDWGGPVGFGSRGAILFFMRGLAQHAPREVLQPRMQAIRAEVARLSRSGAR